MERLLSGINFAIVAVFVAFVELIAFIQMRYLLKLELQWYFFIIPGLLGSIIGIVFVMFRRFRECAQAREHYERIAKTDSLTDTMSRYACELVLDMEHRRHRRNDTPFSLIMLDIDDFKVINDTFGHPVGDRVLKELGVCLKRELREMDTVCRWGGEEFMVLLPETSESQLREIAERMRCAVERHEFKLGQPMTISLGGLNASNLREDLKSMIYRVDQMLYKAKREGKNRLVVDTSR